MHQFLWLMTIVITLCVRCGDITAEETSASPQASADLWTLSLDGGIVFHDTIQRGVPSGIHREDLLLQCIVLDVNHVENREPPTPPAVRLVSIDSPLARVAERLQFRAIDFSNLDLNPVQPQGSFAVTLGRGSQHIEMGHGINGKALKSMAVKPVLDWHIGGRQRLHGESHTIELEMAAWQGDRRLAITLDHVLGENSSDKPSQPLTIIIDQRQDRWTLHHLDAATWNRAIHVLDDAEISIVDKTLHARLNIIVKADPWVPADQTSRSITINLSAPLIYGEISGRAQLLNSWNNTETSFSGTLVNVYRGSYQLHGPSQSYGGSCMMTHRQLAPTAATAVSELQPIAAPTASPAVADLTIPGVAGWHSPAGRHQPDAQPPISWSLTTGTNVAWQYPTGLAGQVVIHNEVAYLATEQRDILAINLNDGSLRWRCTVPAGRPGAQAQPKSVPVVSDVGIFMRWNNDSVSHISLAGELIWHNNFLLAEKPYRLYDEHGSPVLVNDLLIWALRPGKAQRKVTTADGELAQHKIISVTAATGESVWHQYGRGSLLGLAPMQLQRPDGTQDIIIITSNGYAWHARTGQLLAQDIFPFTSFGEERPIPIVQGSYAYFTHQFGQSGHHFSWRNDGSLQVTTVFDQRRLRRHGKQGLVVGNNIFLPRLTDEWHDTNPINWLQLDSYDRVSGQHLGKVKPAAEEAMQPLPLMRVGQYLVLCETGAGNYGHYIRRPHARIMFYTIDDLPRLVSTVALPPKTIITAIPQAAGTRLLIQSQNDLICVAVLGDQGIEAQHRAKANGTLQRIGQRPQPRPVIDIAPVAAVAPSNHPAMNIFKPKIMPQHWLISGPWSREILAMGDSLPTAFKSIIGRGDQWMPDQIPLHMQRPFDLLPQGVITAAGLARVETRYGRRYSQQHSLLLRPLLKQRSGQCFYLTCLLQIDTTITVEPSRWTLGKRAWLSGHAFTEHDSLRLAPGCHQLVIGIQINRLPPLGQPSLSFHLRPSRDPDLEQADWLAGVAREQGQLKLIIQEAPHLPQAIIAQQFLDMLP